MNFSNNVKYLFLGKYITPKVAGSVTSVTDLTDGAIAIIDKYGVTQAHAGWSTSAIADGIKIVVRNGNELIESPLIHYNHVTKAQRVNYVEEIEQVTYIGYTGAANSIEVINDNQYNIRNLLIGMDQVSMGQQKMVYGMYHSLTTDTQANIAYELCSNLTKNANGLAVAPFYADRTYSGAQTLVESAGTMSNWTVSQGSQYITSLGGAHNVAVGNILCLAGLTFVVTELTSATVCKIDIPWQHPSGTVLASDLSTGAVTIDTNPNTSTIILSAAHGVATGGVVYLGIANNGATAATAQFYSGIVGGTTPTTDIILDNIFRGTANNACVLAGGTCAAAGNWGIRIQGKKKAFNTARDSKWAKSRFKTTIENFGATVITENVGASEGKGRWEAVAELEWFCQGFEGNEYKRHYLTNVRKEVLSTGKYDTITIDYYSQNGPYALGDTKQMPAQVIIVMDDAAGIHTSAGITHTFTDALVAVLDDYFTTIT